MPWLSRREVRELREEFEKAKGQPPAGARDVASLVDAITRAQGYDVDLDQDGRPLPRPDSWERAKFGPSWPLDPEFLDVPRLPGGQPDPRIWQYPVNENLRYFSDRHVDWEILRQTADMPLPRACIQIRKDELSTLDWVIRVDPVAAENIARKSQRSKEDVANELREKYEAEIDRLTDFWELPDRLNDREFSEWIGLALDEQLSTDALAIYPQKNYGGETMSLVLIDGDTIKPLLNEQGGRPQPPFPAYQQVLYGFPRGEYTADTWLDEAGNVTIPGGMTTGQLIYRRRVPRIRSPFGFSATEQALLDTLLYNKRWEWMLSEYTEGAQPVQFMKTSESSWTSRQLLEFERDFNDRYSGQTAMRHRNPFLPPGVEPANSMSIPERYKPDYDLYLVKLNAMHYSVTIAELGFTEIGGLGSAGYHQGQEDVNYHKGRLPDIRWFGQLVTHISRRFLGAPKELEFAFLGLEEEDEAASDEVAHNRVASGRMTLNEDRSRLGLPSYQFPEADMPMVETARGVVFIQGASQQAPPGVLIEPASEKPDNPEDDSAGTGQSPTQRRPIASSKPGQAAKDELAAFRKWAGKHPLASRKFEFTTLSKDEARDLAPDLLDDERVVFKANRGGGGAGPKGIGPAGSATFNSSPYSRRR